MKNVNLFLFFVISLLHINSSSACTCPGSWSFCETIDSSFSILEIEVISKYSDPLLEQLEHIDIKILETIQNGITEDSLTVTTNAIMCEYPLLDFNVGDTLLINFNQINNPSDLENHPSIIFSLCYTSFLKLSNGEVSGNIRPNINFSTENYEEFKTNLAACSETIANHDEVANLERSISFFPNPTSNNIILNFSKLDLSEVSFELFSSQGKIFFSENDLKQNNYSFSLIELPKGIYYLRIRYRHNWIVEKVIKI